MTNKFSKQTTQLFNKTWNKIATLQNFKHSTKLLTKHHKKDLKDIISSVTKRDTKTITWKTSQNAVQNFTKYQTLKNTLQSPHPQNLQQTLLKKTSHWAKTEMSSYEITLDHITWF